MTGARSQLTKRITYTNKPFIKKDDSSGSKRLTVSQEPKPARHKDTGLADNHNTDRQGICNRLIT